MLTGCALVLALAGAARAERVLVLAGGEPPCVRAAELAAALGRHGQLATVVRAVPERSDAALVGVRATAAGLEVRLLRPSGLSERVIATPPCEVAVEVVAAWVASVLDGTLVVAAPSVAPANAPTPPTPPTPAAAPAPAALPAPPVDMRAAVLAELAWAGLDLEQSGYSLALEGRAGNWRLALGRDGCTRRRAVGGVPPMREAAVTRLVAAVASMLGDPAGCLRGEDSPERRRRLGRAMAATLDGSQIPVQPLFSLSLGTLSLIGAAADSAPGDDQEILLGIGGGLMLAGGAVGWGLDDETYAEPVLDTLMWTGAGLSAVVVSAEPEAAVFIAQGVIELFEGMLNPPVPRARLRKHLRRMKGSAAPSSADIAAAERDLRRSRSQPYRIATALNFFGAAVATATREPGAELSDAEERKFRSRAATSASLLICIGVIMVLDRSRWSDYQGRVRDSSVRVDVAPTAGGATLSARGRF